jgi:hypothetical protein
MSAKVVRSKALTRPVTDRYKKIDTWEKQRQDRKKKLGDDHKPKRRMRQQTRRKRAQKFYTEGEGRNGLFLIPNRVKRSMRNNHAKAKMQLAEEKGESTKSLPVVRLAANYTEPLNGAFNALINKIMKHSADIARHARHRNKDDSQRHGVQLMLSDLELCLSQLQE